MKRIVLYVSVMAVMASAFLGCATGVNTILKSNKPDLMYARAMELFEAGKWSKASTLFEGAQHWYRGSPREDSLLYYNAYCKFKNRDFETAATLLDDFRRKFGRSVFIEDAEGIYAMCYFYLSPEPKRDQTMTRHAIVAISEFMSRYPESSRIESFRSMNADLMQRLYDKSYYNAYTYYKIGKYKSAMTALKNALKQYPETTHREEIMALIVSSAYKLAHNSVESKQPDRYLSMLDSYYSFRAEYPESPRLAEMERMVKEAKDYSAKNNKQ